MPTMSTLKEREQATQDAIAAPGTIDLVCAAIAATSTLAAYCDEHGLVFSLMAAWIEADKERRSRYAAALVVREQHLKDQIITQLRNMITSDITTAFAIDGSMLPLDKIPPGVRHWIAGIEVEELFAGKGEERRQIGYLRKIKFFDKVRSTELLMKNLKMLIEKHEHSGTVTLAELLAGEAPAKPGKV